MRRTIRNLIALAVFASFLLEFASPADAQFRRRRARNYNYAPAPTYYYEQSSAPVYYEQSSVPVYTQPAEEEQFQTQPNSVTTTTTTNFGGRRLSYFQNTPIHLSNGATAGRVVDYVLSD